MGKTRTDSDSMFGPAACLSCGRSFLGPFPNRLPEIVLGEALALLDTLPGAVQQCLEARGASQQQALQVIVIIGHQQHGGGLAVARNDDWTFAPAFVEISTQP